MAANNAAAVAAAAGGAPAHGVEGGGAREVVIPIDAEGATPRERGQITYRYNTEAEPRGVFSFAWYYRPRPSAGNRNQTEPVIAGKYYTYLKGMSKYYELTEAPSFAWWKVVIYTDRATLASIDQLPDTLLNPARRLARDLLSRSNIILAICEWPEFSQAQTADSIDGVILRMLRHKALMDFPHIPVFVRDADTYFTNELRRANFSNRLLEWEDLMLEHHMRSGLPFLVAGSPTYKRGWHKNRVHNVQVEGVLAGLVNRVGEIPEWTDGSLWSQSLSFVRGRCRIIPDIGALSNRDESTYIGKDEQVIIFIWIPTLLDRTFFFYFDFHNHGLETGEYLSYWSYDPRPHGALDFHHGTALALAAEFPQYVRDGRIMSQIGASPHFKLIQLFGQGRRAVSPYPGYVPPTENEKQADREAGFERGLKEGKFIESDRGALTSVYGLAESDITLLHPYVVTHAFENPVYQRIMYLMFRESLANYEVVCKRTAAGAAGGEARGGRRRKQKRRTSKKRVVSRKTRRRKAW